MKNEKPLDETRRSGGLAKILAILVPAIWMAATSLMLVKMLAGQKSAGGLAGILGLCYILVLIWHLARTRPYSSSLPDLSSVMFPGLRFLFMLGIIVAVIVGVFLADLWHFPLRSVPIALTIAALFILLVWRRRISLRIVLFAAAAGLLTAISGWGLTCLRGSAAGPSQWNEIVLRGGVFVTIWSAAGALLLEQSGLTCVRALKGDYSCAIRSFAWGCVLALPAALFPLLDGPQRGDTDVIKQWWQPFCALQPGISEEVYARLFLLTGLYVLLRPTTNRRPWKAVLAAVLIAGVVHGLAHVPTEKILGPAGLEMLGAGALYGVPLGLLFVKRDLEQAIGYHFFIDFVRFLVSLVAPHGFVA
jgi:hypothetical protein